MNSLFKTRRRKGALTVEFALCAPILFLMLMGSVEFARISVIGHTMNNAAYEAARHGITPGATAEEVENVALSILGTVGARDTVITVSPAAITQETTEVTVEIDVPLDSNGWISSRFFPGRTLSASLTLNRERY